MTRKEIIRDVTQFGSVSVLGTEGRRFKSCHSEFLNYTLKGIRIPVTSVKGKCPRPLDDEGKCEYSM